MEPVLLPEDISAADARRILDFVNAVTDARTVADAVGFSEGREIGLAVAGEIVAARRRLGRLGSLEELFGVTRVTPARFTEIAMALSAARPGTRGRGGTLSITPSADPDWLGAAIDIAVARRDREARPMPGAPVTVIAGWGRLTGQDGAATRRGAAVTVRTGPDGVARLDLAPPLDPPLPPGARMALGAALARLPAGGDAAAVSAGLAAMAATYRAGGSTGLRTAVERLAGGEEVVPTAHGVAPSQLSVTLIAIADGGAGPIAVSGLTLLDWRAAFLGALAAAVRAGDEIGILLGAYAPDAAADTSMARGLIAAAAAAEAAETGRLARRFQPQATTSAFGRFLDGRASASTGLDTLVRVAGSAEAASGLRAIEAIETVQDVRGKGGVSRDLADRLGARIGRLEETSVDRVALAASAAELRGATESLISGVRASLEGRIAALPDRAAFDALQARVAGKADADAVARLGTRLEAAEGTIARKLEAGALDDVTRRLTAAEQRAAGFDARLAGTETALGQVRGEVAGKADSTALDALGTRLDTAAGAIAGKLDAGALDDITRRQTALERGFVSLDGRVDGLGGEIQNIRREVATVPGPDRLTGIEQALDRLGASLREIDGRIGSVDARVSGLTRSVGELEARAVNPDDIRVVRDGVAALQSQTASLAQDVRTTAGGLDALRADVARKADAQAVRELREDVTGIRTENERLKTRVDTVDTRVGDIDSRVGRVVVNRPIGPLR